MESLFGFAPFVVFCVASQVSTSFGIWLALAVAFCLTIRHFTSAAELRPLDAAQLLIFASLALITAMVVPPPPVSAVRLYAEVPLSLLALYSLARRQPLTRAYPPGKARRRPLRALTGSLKAHNMLTAAWGLSFAAMAAGDLAALADPSPSNPGDSMLSLAALGVVIAFTLRYPSQLVAANSRSRRT